MRTWGIVLAWSIAFSSSPSAQRPTDVTKWTIAPAAVTVAAQGTAKVTIVADVEEGWHLYALTQPKDGPPPLRIGTGASQPFEVRPAAIDAPPPKVAEDPNFNTETFYYEGRVVFGVPLSARKDAPAGTHRVPIDVTFQVCNDSICLRPFTHTLFVDATIRGNSKGSPR